MKALQRLKDFREKRLSRPISEYERLDLIETQLYDSALREENARIEEIRPVKSYVEIRSELFQLFNAGELTNDMTLYSLTEALANINKLCLATHK